MYKSIDKNFKTYEPVRCDCNLHLWRLETLWTWEQCVKSYLLDDLLPWWLDYLMTCLLDDLTFFRLLQPCHIALPAVPPHQVSGKYLFVRQFTEDSLYGTLCLPRTDRNIHPCLLSFFASLLSRCYRADNCDESIKSNHSWIHCLSHEIMSTLCSVSHCESRY